MNITFNFGENKFCQAKLEIFWVICQEGNLFNSVFCEGFIVFFLELGTMKIFLPHAVYHGFNGVYREVYNKMGKMNYCIFLYYLKIYNYSIVSYNIQEKNGTVCCTAVRYHRTCIPQYTSNTAHLFFS